jgi:hypothetical protein
MQTIIIERNGLLASGAQPAPLKITRQHNLVDRFQKPGARTNVQPAGCIDNLTSNVVETFL